MVKVFKYNIIINYLRNNTSNSRSFNIIIFIHIVYSWKYYFISEIDGNSKICCLRITSYKSIIARLYRNESYSKLYLTGDSVLPRGTLLYYFTMSNFTITNSS